MELLRESRELFLDDSRELLPQLDKLVACGETRELEKGAYHLKGALANLGAIAAQSCAALLEKAARDGELSQAEEFVVLLRKESEPIVSEATTPSA